MFQMLYLWDLGWVYELSAGTDGMISWLVPEYMCMGACGAGYVIEPILSRMFFLFENWY